MDIKDLEIYKLSKEASEIAWKIYKKLDFSSKKIMGDQFIRSVDSIGANIAEGYGRFHYLDRNKFNYNARGSLLESIHWLDSMLVRDFINQKDFDELFNIFKKLSFKLNNFIKTTSKLGKEK